MYKAKGEGCRDGLGGQGVGGISHPGGIGRGGGWGVREGSGGGIPSVEL